MKMMMKRAVSFVLFGLGAAALGGCPIYPADRDHRVCVGGECYECPDSFYSSACSSWKCNDHDDCPSGYSCNSDHRCRFTDDLPPGPNDGTACTKPSDCPPGSNCGADNRCHSGFCSESGCPAGFTCKQASGSGGRPECVPVTSSNCKRDQDCPTPAGSKCLSGKCTAPVDQCADATQCVSGQCVDGVCTPSCSATKPCPTGYQCDTAKGVCTINPGPCSSTTQCNGGKVCVDEHCVDPCGPGETCPAGLICVDGGCMPNERPVFSCDVDGVQDRCAVKSICLRRSCYIGCDQAQGTEACKNADQFNVCKPVTTSSGTHHVCGSATNLGTECDVTQNKPCASPLICIDGYCK